MAWRPRWYHWTIAAITLLVLVPAIAAMAWRSAGFRRYDAVIAEQTARGVPTTIDDLIALGPASDRGRDARARAWLAKVNATGLDSVAVTPDVFDAWAQGAVADWPTKLLSDVTRLEPVLAAGRPILRERPSLTCRASLSDQFAGRSPTLAEVNRVQVPSLLAARLASQGFALDALRAVDPEPALDDLAALCRGFRDSPTLIEALILIALERERDDAHLRLAALGRLAPPRCEAWAREGLDLLAVVGDGLRGERLLYGPAVAAEFRREPFSPLLADSGFATMGWSDRLLHAIWAGHDCALAAELLHGAETRLRTRHGAMPRWPTGTWARLGHGHTFFPNLVESAVTAWDYETAQRIRRLAACVLIDPSALPDDHAAFVARFADHPCWTPGPDRAALVYERLSATRFRVSLDPATPLPDFGVPNRIPLQLMLGKPSRTIGTPPRLPLLDIGRMHVEAEVRSRP
ncbi:MAG TPA: hypothetical protein VEL07_04180 [Planctomycetota bacterium]|nr:hypothetical protein [Planctomycetota bacterium]